jgi:hypothetical protein
VNHIQYKYHICIQKILLYHSATSCFFNKCICKLCFVANFCAQTWHANGFSCRHVVEYILVTNKPSYAPAYAVVAFFYQQIPSYKHHTHVLHRHLYAILLNDDWDPVVWHTLVHIVHIWMHGWCRVRDWCLEYYLWFIINVTTYRTWSFNALLLENWRSHWVHLYILLTSCRRSCFRSADTLLYVLSHCAQLCVRRWWSCIYTNKYY